MHTEGLLSQLALYQNPGEGVICYLDEIMVYGPDCESVEQITRWVLMALKENKMFLKAPKFTFYSQQINYIGLVYTPEGMEPEEGKKEAICAWPAPTDPWTWLGFAGFYMCFVVDFSKLMKPITDPTSKGAKWEWTK